MDDWLVKKKDQVFTFDPATQVKDCLIINSFTKDKTKEIPHYIYLLRVKDASPYLLPNATKTTPSLSKKASKKSFRFLQQPAKQSPPPNYMKITFIAKENEEFKKFEKMIFRTCKERREILKTMFSEGSATNSSSKESKISQKRN